MPVGITNFLNVEQLWTCSSYLHALKNVTASQVKKQMPLSQTWEPMCVTAEPPAHSTVQSLALRHILMRIHCKVFMNFNDFISLSFLLLLRHLLLGWPKSLLGVFL